MSAAPQLRLFSRFERRALEQAFETWFADNPAVWRLFVRFTFEAIAAGHKHYSADAIVHRIRWHTSVETRGDEFMVNNNHVALLARRFAEQYAQHAEFFRMRERG